MSTRTRVRIAAFSLILAAPMLAIGSAGAVFPDEGNRALLGRTETGEAPHVFSVRFDGSGELELTTNPELAAFPGHWSPNGRRFVALAGVGQGDLYTWKRNGTDRERLTNNAPVELFPAWAPSGRWIVFVQPSSLKPGPASFGSATAPAGRTPSFEPTGVVGGGGRLKLIRADGERRRKVLRSDGQIMFPAFDPDGSRIAYVWQNPNNSLYWTYVVDPDGDNARKLTPGFSQEIFYDWSPNGRRIVSNTKAFGWITRKLDGSGIQPLGEPTKGCGTSAAMFAPDGQHVFVQFNDCSDDEIWYMEVGGANAVRLTDNDTDDVLVTNL